MVGIYCWARCVLFLLWFVFAEGRHVFLLWFGFTGDMIFVFVSYFTGGFAGDVCLVIGGLF